jgi:hypothetical protein
MHLKVICRVCEKNASFNTTLGIYFCPKHGYETRLVEKNRLMSELVSNLEQIKMHI